MSWESTASYYQQINEAVKVNLGGLHSAKIILYSVDFHEIERLQHAGDWDGAGAYLAVVAQSLECAGADFLVLCTNTMHKVAPAIEATVNIPLLHIADPTASALRAAGFSKAGLLGTRFTMEEDFYRARLIEQHGVDVIIPQSVDREIIHRIIYDELCLGQVLSASRAQYTRIMQALVADGAQCIILGCTEISLLVGAQDATVPLFDTTAIHALTAAQYAMAGDALN